MQAYALKVMHKAKVHQMGQVERALTLTLTLTSTHTHATRHQTPRVDWLRLHSHYDAA